MQSNKSSKKTRTIAEENSTAVPASDTADNTSKPRSSRSSKSKNDTNETGPARHRKPSSAVVSEKPPIENAPAVAETVPAAKRFAASVGTGSPLAGSSIDATLSAPAQVVPTEIAEEEIATLAHYYWIARGGAHGSAEEDWLRAEKELKAKRSAR